MAQFFDDFNDGTPGNAVTDWARTWATDETFLYSSLLPTTSVRFSVNESFSRRAAYSTLVGTAADTEIYAIVQATKLSVGTTIPLLIARGNTGNESNRSGYALLVRSGSGNFAVRRLNSSSETTIVAGTKTLSDDTAYKARFKVSGSSPVNVKARVWLATDSEPATWDLDFDDSSASRITVAGQAMIGSMGRNTVIYAGEFINFDDFGVGTNGDPAPTSPISSAVPTLGTITTTATTANSISFSIPVSY